MELVDVEDFSRLWRESTTLEIAKKYNMTRNRVYRVASFLGLPSRQSSGLARIIAPEPESPSTDEIQRLTLEIRSRWSDEEERRRRVGQGGCGRRWTPPAINLRG